MPDQISQTRRKFLGATTLGLAATQLGWVSLAQALPLQGKSAASGATSAQASFAPLKRIKAGVLDVAYAEAGPVTGKPVLLLHGWP
jgi:hypothetical protein